MIVVESCFVFFIECSMYNILISYKTHTLRISINHNSNYILRLYSVQSFCPVWSMSYEYVFSSVRVLICRNGFSFLLVIVWRELYINNLLYVI